MKTLFIYTSSNKLEIASRKFLTVGAHLPPLGILYLAKMLEINGHTAEVIDCNAESISLDNIRKKVLSCDAVGMTIYSELRELTNSIMISKLVKEIDSDIPVLIGGPHCSLMPERSLKEHHADICVKGSGEFVITPIIEALEGKRKLSTIPGIYYKDGDKIRHTKPAEDIKDLDSIPFPARHLVYKYEYGYLLEKKIAKGKLTSISASRGCPHHCRFCSLSAHVPSYKTRSVSNITREIEELTNDGYKTLAFVDDNFLAQKKKVEQIMDFIIQKRMDLKLWIIGARADSADRGLYEKMRGAGVEFISFGIESGNQDVLDFYNKKLTISQIQNTLNLCNEMNFFTHATFILGAPIETKKHIEHTIKFARSLPLSGVTFYPFGYAYGSPIWKEAVNEGKIHSDEGTVIADVQRGLGNLRTEEIMDYSMKAYKNFFLNPRFWMRELSRAITNNDFKYLKLGMRMFTQR